MITSQEPLSSPVGVAAMSSSCSQNTATICCALADNIGQGSALEMCYYLGKLQEEHYLLSKPPKRKGEVDIMIKVPMLG